MPNKLYRTAQLKKLQDDKLEYPIKIKLSSENGDTNWLDISTATYLRIKKILTNNY